MTDQDAAEPPFVWCVVANMRSERRAGPGGAEVWQGSKHFRPGAKLYCWPPRWGDGYERIRVVGLSRGRRYITIVLRSEWLTNWRVKAVYDPHLLRLLSAGSGWVWSASDKDKTTAESLVEWMCRREDIQTALRSGALEERLQAIATFIGCSRGEVLSALERVPNMSDTQAIIEEITRWAVVYRRGFREDIHQEER